MAKITRLVGKKPTNIGQIRLFLEKRKQDVETNPGLLETDRWIQSTLFYRLRPIILQKGILLATRQHITESIKDVWKEMGYKRHELGIIVAVIR